MSAEARALLDRAEAMCCGRMTITSGQDARVAAWYVRRALELVVCARLAGTIRAPEEATMRTRLASLTAVGSPIAEVANHVWVTTSRLCHVSSYELVPDGAAVLRIVHLVRGMLAHEDAAVSPWRDPPLRSSASPDALQTRVWASAVCGSTARTTRDRWAARPSQP